MRKRERRNDVSGASEPEEEVKAFGQEPSEVLTVRQSLQSPVSCQTQLGTESH